MCLANKNVQEYVALLKKISRDLAISQHLDRGKFDNTRQKQLHNDIKDFTVSSC